MFDLGSQPGRKAFAEQVKRDIDEFCVEHFAAEHRDHLGASILGHDCSRYLWYVYRWAKLEKHDGRMLRLFNRGELEEARLVAWLRGAGFTVWDKDENGKQHRIHICQEHGGGSLDGVTSTPAQYQIGNPLLLEFKTYHSKAFMELLKQGVTKYRPKHFAQMCLYGEQHRLPYALYIAVNKNDDDLYIECVELDWREAEALHRKAEFIINATEPPPRLSENPAHWECKSCTMYGPCHSGEPLAVNCRSCFFATPIDGGKWYCNNHKQEIPRDFLPKGCDRYQALPQ